MSKVYISQKLREQVTEDCGQRCAYCRSPEQLLDSIYEIDHIVAEKHGGATIRDNLCLTCSVCNRYKGVQQYARDPQTGRRAALFHPRQQKWARHFAWLPDNITIMGRTRCGRATVAALRLNDARLLRMRTLWLEIGAEPPDWKRTKKDK